MMIHHMLSVARRATPPSGASLAPVTAPSQEAEPAPAPSPAAGPVSTYGPASALAATAMADAKAGAQVALPTALAAYREFTE